MNMNTGIKKDTHLRPLITLHRSDFTPKTGIDKILHRLKPTSPFRLCSAHQQKLFEAVISNDKKILQDERYLQGCNLCIFDASMLYWAFEHRHFDGFRCLSKSIAKMTQKQPLKVYKTYKLFDVAKHLILSENTKYLECLIKTNPRILECWGKELIVIAKDNQTATQRQPDECICDLAKEITSFLEYRYEQIMICL